MSTKFQFFIKNMNKRYIQWLSHNFLKTILMFLILSVVLGYFSLRIPLDARIYNLFPQNLESIENNQKLEQYYGGEGYLIASLAYKHPYRDLLRKIEQVVIRQDQLQESLTELINNFKKTNPQDEEVVLREEKLSTFSQRYEKMDSSYRQNLSLLESSPSRDEKLQSLFIRELGEVIIPETAESYRTFLSEQSFQTLKDLQYVLDENMRAFDLYQEEVRKSLPVDTTESLTSLAQSFSARLKDRQDLVLHTDSYSDARFIEDHLLYFLDIKDLEYINQEIQNKIDYERRKNIIAKSLLIDGERNVYTLDFEDLKAKYFKPDGSSFKLIRILNGEESLKKGYEKERKYYVNHNADTLVVLIKAAKGSPDIAFGQRLMTYLDRVVLDMKKTDPLMKKMDIRFYGRYKDRSKDVETLNRDFKVLSPVALIALFVILFVHFRSWQAILIICLPLLSDIIWALGIAYFVIGKLNLISSFIIAIMSGLGVNFGTHLYNRYIEERVSGKSVIGSLTIVFQSTFVSNVTATTTTATGFFVLGTSQFQGFSEFGIIAGIAMLCLLAGVFLVFPAIIFLLERYGKVPIHRKTNKEKQEFLKNKPMPYFKIVIIAGIIMTLISLFGMGKVNFNANFTSLMNQNRFEMTDKEGLEQAENIIGFYNLVPMTIYAPDYKTMQDVTKYILNKEKSARYIQDYRIESLYNYIPDDQEEKARWLKKINTQLNKEILNSVEDAESKDSINRLKEMTLVKPTTFETTPEVVKRLFSGIKEGYFVFFYPTASISNISNIQGFSKEIMDIGQQFKDKGVFVASDSIIFSDIFDIITGEAPLMLAFIFSFFFILLWLDFRSWKKVVVSLIPLGVGIFWIIGFYYLFNFEFNYFNIVMFPVIIAIGLDDGVHLLHRYHEEGPNNIRYIFANTGRSIFIAGIQDIIGFSAFLFAFYVGLNTIGQFLTIGVVSCMLVSTLLLPSVLQFITDIRNLGVKKAIFSLKGIKD